MTGTRPGEKRSSRIKIAVDLTALNPKPSGIDRSLLGLVAALSQLDHENEYVLFIDFEDRGLFRTDPRRASSLVPLVTPPRQSRLLPASLRPRAPRLLFQQVLMPAILRAMRVDVLHSPTFIMPAWRGRAGHVLTVHDMTSFLAPEHHPRRRRGRMYRASIAGSIRRADLVTVPSPSVRKDIARLFPDVHDRVRVVPWGIDAAFRPQPREEKDETLRRLGLSAPYILHVGTLDPRKNVSALVDAYTRLVIEHDLPEHLVLAGQPGWSMRALLSRSNGGALRGRLHFLGYVAEADLPSVYAGARLFVCPSLLEGFGFPPLEAMASGVPVVAARTSSLIDNLEGAAVLVETGNVEALAAAMRALLTDASERERWVEAGLRRAASFRWERCAQEMLRCYQDAARARGRALSGRARKPGHSPEADPL